MSLLISLKSPKPYMKRTIFLSTLLIILAPLAQAGDIILKGGEVDYTDKSQASSSKNTPVKGAALNSDSEVRISETTNIIFSGNLAQNTYASGHSGYQAADLVAGGAIHGATVSIINNSGDISFTENEVKGQPTSDACSRVSGGAIKGGTISISNNIGSNITFDKNKALDVNNTNPVYPYGGALYADTTLDIKGNSNASVSFTGNVAGKGGAISAGYASATTISGNASVSFIGNEAGFGGAVYTGAYVYLNSSDAYGSATLEITDNGEVSFSNNKARSYGGAIYNQANGSVRINNNRGDVTFSGNTAADRLGGAIRGQSNSAIELNGNSGTVSFIGNKVTPDASQAYGGAISLEAGSSMSMNNNSRVELCENTVQTNTSVYGGAVAVYKSELSINGNTGGVSISGNSAIGTSTKSWTSANAEGGAIYGHVLNIRDNSGTVLVQNNKAQSISRGTAKGGAIYVEEALSITGNENVEFRNNLQQDTTQTILRSVYVNSKSASGALNLSAAAGGSISFYDSLYAAPSSSSYKLTADVNKESSATGSVLFSGKYAESDLLAINSAAGADEIEASRTSTIQTAVAVHHGTLAVEAGAVLQSKGMSVADTAALQLHDGVLEMLDSTSLNLAGMLQAEGSNTMSANEVVVADGATFRLTLSETNREAPAARSTDAVVGGRALIALSTTALTYDGTYTVQFNSMESLAEGRYVVLDFSGAEMTKAPEWSTEGVTVTGLGAGDSFGWSDDGTKLYLVHTNAVPEPAAAVLILPALVALAGRRRRKEA